MRVLGIDTATWIAAVGVADVRRAVADRRADARQSHVARLPDLVASTLADAGLGLDEIEAVAVSGGPGSFTGLRIGVAFAKGLAFAAGIPLIGVPTLEAHAAAAAQPNRTLVCVANDARRGEVYAALFRSRGPAGVERCWPDRAWRPADLLDALPAEVVLVGDACGLLAADDRWAGRVCRPLDPSGAVVARLGDAALGRGERVPVGEFEPTYVRAPDATPPPPPPLR